MGIYSASMKGLKNSHFSTCLLCDQGLISLTISCTLMPWIHNLERVEPWRRVLHKYGEMAPRLGNMWSVNPSQSNTRRYRWAMFHSPAPFSFYFNQTFRCVIQSCQVSTNWIWDIILQTTYIVGTTASLICLEISWWETTPVGDIYLITCDLH